MSARIAIDRDTLAVPPQMQPFWEYIHRAVTLVDCTVGSDPLSTFSHPPVESTL